MSTEIEVYKTNVKELQEQLNKCHIRLAQLIAENQQLKMTIEGYSNDRKEN